MVETGRMNATLLIPIYNDWDSLRILCVSSTESCRRSTGYACF